MSLETDKAYLERRARQERDMAERASDPCAYRTHAELARQYEKRLMALQVRSEEADGAVDPGRINTPKSAI